MSNRRRAAVLALIWLLGAAASIAGETAPGTPADPEPSLAAASTAAPSAAVEQWIAEADRLMARLIAVDARIHGLLSEVENPESRTALIRERREIRSLTYELALERDRMLRLAGTEGGAVESRERVLVSVSR